MASVTLTRLWLHDAADLSDFITVRTAELGEVPAVHGEVRRYANGNLRAVRRAGTARQVRVRLRPSVRSDVDQIAAWTGRRLMLRDSRGRKLWGVYWDPQVTEVPGVDRADVSFTFEQVTYNESV